MRAWHLVGLRQAGGERLTFRPPEGGTPLMLPSTIPSGDQEQIIAFFQQVAGDEPLARVEIDWYRGILEGQRDFLLRTHADRGSSGVLLVVKVRTEGVDANAVLATPLVKAFEHVVVASAHPLANERLANLAELSKLVETTLRDAYTSLAEGMGFDPTAWMAVRPIVRLLSNPVDIVEAANALVEIQLEPKAPRDLEPALRRRTLARLFASRPPDELVVFAAHATGKLSEASELLKEERWKTAEGGLAQDLLLRDARLLGWAAWVGLDETRAVLADALEVASRPTHTAAVVAAEWVAEAERALKREGPLWDGIIDVMKLINNAKLARAREDLDALEGEVARAGTTVGDRGLYWAAVGLYRKALGELEEAETAFRRSLNLLERSSVKASNVWHIHGDLARVLRDSGKWPAAEAAFREVLRLQEEGGDTPTNSGITLHHLAVGLRDNGRWPEAEAAFRESLRLGKEGNDTAESLAKTLEALAKGLRDNGRPEEAEAALDEARRLRAGEATKRG